ncbi:MAG: phospholipase C [Streptosporangiaceae bacterium]
MSERPGTAGNGEANGAGTSRRRVLQAGLVAGAAVGVGGWRSAAGAAGPLNPLDKHLRKPGSRPYPRLPVGTDTIPQIEHIVILMMENHSYDNRFGMLRRPGADGFRIDRHGKPLNTNPYRNGWIQHAFRMPTTCQNHKPAQDWRSSHRQLGTGRNNGFVESGSGPTSMGYWERADQPFYYSMASAFPIADRYFCSLLGQTDPNRRYLMAATSLGQVNDTVPKLKDYPANGTIFDHVAAVGRSWKAYYSSVSSTALFPELFIKNAGRKIVKIAEFYQDAAAGKLPGLSLVEPNYDTQSEEDPQDIAAGEQFAAKVIDAVMKGPAWDRTLLVWTYDEHGGYYDHVVPPRALVPDSIKPDVPSGEKVYTGFGQYGFRVPTAVISPYARRDYVSHKVMDHTSICALVEHKWNLPAMTFRDANAWPMLDMLDLRHPAFKTPPKLARPLLGTGHGALKCEKTGPGVIPPPGSITKPKK